ncbi:MAG: Rpp14/Pop5 family protein [Candidatus Hydrothermarchaeaceae archaeon]
MKRLPPTLREKKRYVAFKVVSDEPIIKEEITRVIWTHALSLLGEMQASSLSLWVLDYNESTQEGFLVCRNEELWKVKGVLVLIGEINEKRAHVCVNGVSGTIKALKRKFLNKGPSIIEEKKHDKLTDLEIIRSYGECIDALPNDKELLSRLRDLKMRYIGLMRSDLEMKSNLGGREDATSA